MGGEALEAQGPANGAYAGVEIAQEPTNEADDADPGAADTEIDADYVADVTAAQGAWDPWPTHDSVTRSGLYLFLLHCKHFTSLWLCNNL